MDLNVTLDLNTILSGLTMAGIIAAVGGIWQINAHLAKLNGTVGKMQVWQEQHEKRDDDRFEGLQQSQVAMWKTIHRREDP